MIPNDYRPLVNRLHAMTNNNECNWEATSDRDKFLLTIGSESVIVYYYLSFPEDEPTIGLEILDEYGDRVDAIFISQEDSDYELMWNLYWTARRDALKIKETISKIMLNLDLKNRTDGR